MRALLVLAAVVSCANSAVAAEGPCHEDGDYVTCEKPGFDKLVVKCQDFKRRAEGCEAELAVTKEYVAALEKAAQDCNPVCPVCPPPKVQSGQRQAWGFALGVVGTALAMAAPLFPQLGSTAQVGTVAGGITLIATGFIVNLSFD